MKYPKFIIEGNSLVIGKASFHRDMAINPKDVISGGWYAIDTEKKELHLYGKSEDFGRFKPEEVLECVNNGTIGTRQGRDDIRDYTIYHSFDSWMPKELLIKSDDDLADSK